MSHIKPTQEDLDAGIQAALALENGGEPKKDPAPKVDPKPEAKPDGNPAPKKDDKPTDDKPDDQLTDEQKKANKAAAGGDKPTDDAGDEDPEKVELKKKVANSTRENQIIYAQNKKMAEAFDRATEVAEPTEQELQQTFPDWDGLSDFEKSMAKDKVINDRRFAAIKEASKDFKDLEAWQGKVDEFIGDPSNLSKYPLLEGKEDEFKLYAIKPTRRGVDFDDLVAGFLFHNQTNRPKNKGSQIPTGSGGDKSNQPAKPAKLSVAESARLRETNYAEYRRQLRAGNITEEIPD